MSSSVSTSSITSRIQLLNSFYETLDKGRGRTEAVKKIDRQDRITTLGQRNISQTIDWNRIDRNALKKRVKNQIQNLSKKLPSSSKRSSSITSRIQLLNSFYKTLDKSRGRTEAVKKIDRQDRITTLGQRNISQTIDWNRIDRNALKKRVKNQIQNLSKKLPSPSKPNSKRHVPVKIPAKKQHRPKSCLDIPQEVVKACVLPYLNEKDLVNLSTINTSHLKVVNDPIDSILKRYNLTPRIKKYLHRSCITGPGKKRAIDDLLAMAKKLYSTEEEFGKELSPSLTSRKIVKDLTDPTLESLPLFFKKLEAINFLRLLDARYYSKFSQPHYASSVQGQSKKAFSDFKKIQLAIEAAPNLDLLQIANLFRKWASRYKDIFTDSIIFQVEDQFTLIPTKIHLFKNTTTLQFTSNKLVTIPKEIGKLTSLTLVNLGQNQIKYLPKEIKHLIHLEHLHLGANEINEKRVKLPDELWRLPNLKLLLLSQNPCIILPKSIGLLKNLTYLRVNNAGLTHIPKEVGKLTKLEHFFVRENLLTSLPPELLRLKKTTLYLEGNQLGQ